MFAAGNRVKLKNDFNNEPGIVPKGTEGRILTVMPDDCSFQYYVVFDNPDDNEIISEVQERLGGFPLFDYEIEPA